MLLLAQVSFKQISSSSKFPSALSRFGYSCIQMCVLSAETRKLHSFLPVANSSYQATLLFKSYMTVNTGPCRLLGCFT